MVISDENNLTTIKPNAVQGGLEGMGSRKFGHNRRVLGVINQNLVAARAYPCVNKRGLSEKNSVFGPPARSQKLKTSTRSTNEFGDCIFIDEEEQNEQSEDHPMAMQLGASDTKLSEAVLMTLQEEEIEMEDVIIEEPVMDIDKSDAKNPLAAVEYVEELYDHYRKMEVLSCVAPDYIDQQSDINANMRAILIDWLIEVHDKFDLLDETLFLTVNLIDRFLSKQAVVRKKLQLVGLVALLLACKYEEVSVPAVGDLVIISDRAYTRTDVLEMEKLMLNKLQFNFSFPTPYVFLKRFLKAAHSDKKMEVMAFFLMELSLVEYEMLRFEPSLLAAAAVYTAQCTLHGFRQWNRACEWHSQYSEEQLQECSRMMVCFHQNAAVGKMTGVHRKYCSSRFGHIAKCKPAIF